VWSYYCQYAAFNNILPNYNVSRTGYNETDLTDNKASNTKIDFCSLQAPLQMILRLFGKVSLVMVMQFIKVQTGIT
jgi:hypothetical protein